MARIELKWLITVSSGGLVYYMRFTTRFKYRSPWLWRHVALWCDTNFSENHSASIFRVKAQRTTVWISIAVKLSNLPQLQAGCFLLCYTLRKGAPCVQKDKESLTWYTRLLSTNDMKIFSKWGIHARFRLERNRALGTLHWQDFLVCTDPFWM